jgi:phosphate-selective porin OprO and OprP
MRKLIISLILLFAIGTAKLAAQGCGGPASDDALKIFGFLQSQYEYNFENQPKNSFSFERARIGVMGSIPYDFSYYVVMELSPFIAPNPYLLDAFITYSRYNWARVSIGSFKTPIGLETNIACNGMLTVYRSTVTLQTVAPFRDIGMVFMGGDETTLLSYQIGIMNGSGLGRLDNNKMKDIVGRVLFKPVDFVKIGGSFRTGYPSYNNNDDSRTTLAGELQANFKGFSLQAEYIMDKGDYNRDLGGGCSGNLIDLGEKRNGGYATFAYLTKWNLEPVFKYDFFDSGNAQNYKESNMTYGLNYYFNDWTRLQLNYIYRAEKPTEVKNDELVLQLQVKF